MNINYSAFTSKASWRNKAACIALLFAGTMSAANATPINVALESNGGVATQSSTIGSPGSDGQLQVASRAIDGDTNGNWHTGAITHTNQELQPWWEVALGGGSTFIDEIDVWNRTDCCVNRLDGFDVLVLDAGQIVWSSLNNSYTLASPEASFFLSPSIMGDTVRIQLRQGRYDYLSLAEVQVWAEPASIPEPATLALLAVGLIGVRFTRSNAGRPLSPDQIC